MQSLNQLQQLFQEELEKHHFQKQPAELYEPFRYILSLGGKRMRPVALLLACDLFGGDLQKALKPSLAIELFHNFTLIHDDIMDKAPIRRGKPTVHKKWNNNIAILSGDVMFIYAYEFIKQVDQDILPQIIDIFNKTAIEVCEGQQLDLNYEMQQQISVDQYLKMIELKTAVLLGCSFQIGAILAKASPEDVENIYSFGKNMGIAFQLQDDILDTYGDGDKFGKKVGGDIILNKKTYLLIKALEKANGNLKNELQERLNEKKFNEKEKIAAITQIYDRLNVREQAEALMEQYYSRAVKNLDDINVPDECKLAIRSFAEMLMVRQV